MPNLLQAKYVATVCESELVQVNLGNRNRIYNNVALSNVSLILNISFFWFDLTSNAGSELAAAAGTPPFSSLEPPVGTT